MARDAVTGDDAVKPLQALKDREATLRDGLDRLDEVLAELPDQERMRRYVQNDGGPGGIFVYDDEGNTYPGGNTIGTFLTMSREDKRRLVAAVFDQPLIAGKPARVYISQNSGVGSNCLGRWTYRIRARQDSEMVMMTAGPKPDGHPSPSPAVSHALGLPVTAPCRC